MWFLIKKSEKDIKLELNDYQIDEDDNIITPNSTWFLLRKEFLDQRMNEYNLKEGDSIFYDSIINHHVHGANGKAAKILAVVYTPF